MEPTRKSLRLLLVEDSEWDATLLLKQLEQGGYAVHCLRVETAEQMRSALEKQPWDFIISDYVMPQFSGLDALALLKGTGQDLPFIIVSGHIGEEIAVASMKAGAHDYVMKDKLARLLPAIERELREAEIRRQRRQSEKALRESEEKFRQLAEHIDAVFFLSEEVQAEAPGPIFYVSPAYERIFGSPAEVLYKKPLAWLKIVHPEDQPRVQAALPKMRTGEFNEQFRIIRPDQAVRWIQYRSFPVRNEQGEIYRIAGLAEDITERVEAQQKLQASNEELAQAREHLERRVAERTTALRQANAQLHGQINERKRLENELLEIAEKERRRIGIDLHDELGQQLNGLALMMKGLELKLGKRGSPEVADASKIQVLISKSIQQARAVAQDLASQDIESDDLTSALKALASHVENLFQITCRLRLAKSIPPLPQMMVKQLYKIAQEAITNAIKHAKAKEVEISLTPAQDHLVLAIRNDGFPFPVKRLDNSGMGLRIMQYRASVISGSVEIKCGPQSTGAVVTCTFPNNAEMGAAESERPVKKHD